MAVLSELAAFGVLVVCSFAGGVIGGFIAQALRAKLDNYRVDVVEGQVERLKNALYGREGNASRIQKSERMSEAIAVLMQEIHSGKEPKEALAEVAKAYPDVAIDVLKKGLKGGALGGLEKLF